MSNASCRLFVISAQSTAKAIILRRGPSKWYHLILWDMALDVFQEGAWFHGRIYEERCDLSHDGRYLLYFAYKHIRIGNESIYAYTALSRAPYLHALVLWPECGTWGGGGRFLGHQRIALRGFSGQPFPALPKGLRIEEGNRDLHRSSKEVPDADWCGLDHRGQQIYTVGGKLFRIVKSKAVELADFSNQRPDPQPPPEWATRPL